MIEQGEKAACLYLLTRGEVTVRYKPYDGEPINLNRIREGGVFGWSAVLGSDEYSSSVVCNTACELLMVYGKDLRTLQANHPQTSHILLEQLARAVSSRWANAQAQVKSMIKKGVQGNSNSGNKGGVAMAENVQTHGEVEQIRALVDQLSAYIEQFHGGSVEFVELSDDTLKVKLGGACLGCPLSPATLHGWVEGTVHQFFPHLKVVQVF